MGQHLRVRRKEDRDIVGFTLLRDHFSCGVYREVGQGENRSRRQWGDWTQARDTSDLVRW